MERIGLVLEEPLVIFGNTNSRTAKSLANVGLQPPLSLHTDSLCFLLLVSNVLGFPYVFSKGVRTAASDSKVFFKESS